MAEEEREPYSWDVVEIGMVVGHIAQLNAVKRHRRKNPIGFAPSAPTRRRRGERVPGSWPEVPFFDIP